MRRLHLPALAVAVVAMLAAGRPAGTSAASPDTTTNKHDAKHHYVSAKKLIRAVTVKGILEHQRALQDIADANGGTRHTETPGYTASGGGRLRSDMRRAASRSRSRSSTCRSGGRPRRRSSSS